MLSTVLREEPVEIKMRVVTADFGIVGPNAARSTWWTLLFDWSYKRGDWLRPVTGWIAGPPERTAWERGRKAKP